MVLLCFAIGVLVLPQAVSASRLSDLVVSPESIDRITVEEGTSVSLSGVIGNIASAPEYAPLATNMSWYPGIPNAHDIYFDGTYLWVTSQTTDGGVYKVSQSGSMTKYSVPHASYITRDGSGNFWVTQRAKNTISKVTSSGSVTEYDRICTAPQMVVYAAGSIWVSCVYGELVKVASDGTYTPIDTGLTRGGTMASDGSSLWIVGGNYETLAKVSMSTYAVTQYSGGVSNNNGIAFDGTNMWITDYARSQGGDVVKISPSGNQTPYDMVGSSRVTSITYSGGSLWAGTYSGQLINFSTSGTLLSAHQDLPHFVSGIVKIGNDVWTTAYNSDAIAKTNLNSGESFSRFQISNTSYGGGTRIDLPIISTPVINGCPGACYEDNLLDMNDEPRVISGAPVAVRVDSAPYTFNDSGEKSYRLCADVTNVIREHDDANNCSAWRPITVNPKIYNLTVSRSGAGTITSSPSGISCGSDCSHTYTDGTSVTLTASPNSYNHFTGWSGACSGTGSCSVVMTSNRSVSANFQANQCQGSIPANAQAHDSEESSNLFNNSTNWTYSSWDSSSTKCQFKCNAGLAWDGNSCEPAPTLTFTASDYTVNSGDSTTLSWTTSNTDSCTASGAWSGSKAASGGSETMTNITSSRTYTLRCENSAGVSVTRSLTVNINTRNLSVSKTGTGAGTITSSPSGISCGSDCFHTYNNGTSVTLTASPNSSSDFIGWSGACSGTGSCSVAMTSNRSVTANFAAVASCSPTATDLHNDRMIDVQNWINSNTKPTESVSSVEAAFYWGSPVWRTPVVTSISATNDGCAWTDEWTSGFPILTGSCGTSGNTYGRSVYVCTNSCGETKSTVINMTQLCGPEEALNLAPTANAGPNGARVLPANSFTVSGAGASDFDGIIVSRSWTKVSGPAGGNISGGTTLTPTFSGMNTAGTYRFRLTVTDNDGASDSDDMEVAVSAAPITAPTLSLTRSPSTINAGDPSTLTWTVSGTADSCWASGGWSGWKTFSGTNNEIVTPSNTTTYNLECWNQAVSSGRRSVTVNVNTPVNAAPTANAGGDRVITLPTNSATDNGSSGTDSDGSIVSISWTKVSGPAGGSISGADGYNPTFTNLNTDGDYIFRLTVTDDDGASDSDEMMVRVNPAIPPDISLNGLVTSPGSTDNGSGQVTGNGLLLSIGNAGTEIPAGPTIDIPVQIVITSQSTGVSVTEYETLSWGAALGSFNTYVDLNDYDPDTYDVEVTLNHDGSANSIDSDTANNSLSRTMTLALAPTLDIDVDINSNIVRSGTDISMAVSISSDFEVTCELAGSRLHDPSDPPLTLDADGVIRGITAESGNPFNYTFMAGPIVSTSVYTVSCEDSLGNAYPPAQDSVNVVPTLQET